MTHGWRITCAVLSLSLTGLFHPGMASANELLLTPEEIERVLSHGPWPAKTQSDPSNRVSGNPDAIELGKTLFFSPKLSANGKTSCASCHQPERNFTDGKARALGARVLDRNTLALQNLNHRRWFGWGGENDNLWAQSIFPIQNPDELNLTAQQVTEILGDPDFLARYTKLFGSPEAIKSERNLVNVGKLLAAYQETLVSGQTEFDRFRDALAAEDWATAATYPRRAQRGLKIFIGRGNCSFCHSGPLFTNGEFHDSAVPYFVEPGRVDSGRHIGIEKLRSSPFTLDGDYNDDPEKSGAWAVRRVVHNTLSFGTFRVPGLRNVTKTAPYMHNGSLDTLDDVVLHYSNIDIERLHADGELILRPLNLSEREIVDIVRFLYTLNSELPQ